MRGKSGAKRDGSGFQIRRLKNTSSSNLLYGFPAYGPRSCVHERDDFLRVIGTHGLGVVAQVEMKLLTGRLWIGHAELQDSIYSLCSFAARSAMTLNS